MVSTQSLERCFDCQRAIGECKGSVLLRPTPLLVRFRLLILTATGLVATIVYPPSVLAADRPNLVVILADDLG